MDELKQENPGGTPSGPCTCTELDVKDLPNDKQPFRRLLDALTEKLKELAKEPTEATNKFPDELKDAEKEYQGIEAIVAKYKEFYDKQLDCKLADARRWRDAIIKWSTIDEATKKAIRDYRKEHYDDREKQICCDTWIRLKNELNGLGDCLVQARNTEAQKQASYDALKTFLDTLNKIFSDLEALFKKADGFNKDGKPKLVFAISLEFDDLYRLIDWPKTAEEKCATGSENGDTGSYGTGSPDQGKYEQQPSSGGGYEETPETSGEGSQGEEGSSEYNGFKRRLSPDKFRARLLAALRQLLLAKYHRFLLHHELLKKTADVETARKDCEKFKADRQKLFLDDVEDIPIDQSGTGNGGGGTGTEQPPSTGGYPQQPSGGGYQQPPPTGGYQTQPPSGGGYRQEPPSGGHQPQPPSGGYEKPATGGYEKRPKEG